MKKGLKQLAWQLVKVCVEVEVGRVKQTGMLQLARMVNRTPLAVFLQLIADEMFQQHHGRCFYDFESDVAETSVCSVETGFSGETGFSDGKVSQVVWSEVWAQFIQPVLEGLTMLAGPQSFWRSDSQSLWRSDGPRGKVRQWSLALSSGGSRMLPKEMPQLHTWAGNEAPSSAMVYKCCLRGSGHWLYGKCSKGAGTS